MSIQIKILENILSYVEVSEFTIPELLILIVLYEKYKSKAFTFLELLKFARASGIPHAKIYYRCRKFRKLGYIKDISKTVHIFTPKMKKLHNEICTI